MGTWGYKPWENDTAADWLGGIRSVLYMGLSSKRDEEVIIAASVLDKLSDIFKWDAMLFGSAAEEMERILKSDYVKGWKSDQKIVIELQGIYNRLDKIAVEAAKRYKESIKKRHGRRKKKNTRSNRRVRHTTPRGKKK
jgi:hypothetical protein